MGVPDAIRGPASNVSDDDARTTVRRDVVVRIDSRWIILPDAEVVSGIWHEVVDGAVDGVGDAVRAGGRSVRRIQTGNVQSYLLLAVLVVVVLVATFVAIVLLQDYLLQLSAAALVLVAALLVAFAVQSRRSEKESKS